MTVESTAAPGTRIVGLDALRGLAALAVVLFHYTTRYTELFGTPVVPGFNVPWGHFGVQLFFAISGFVIFMTLERTRSLTDFAVSRFSRLYPAYWTAILVTTAAMALAGMSEFAQPASVVALNLTMIENFIGVPPVDGVYWTLSVELAFYVVMAALWKAGLLRRVEPILLCWMGLKWFWTFAPPLLGIEPSWLLGALLIQSYIPFFAIGIAAYRLRGSSSERLWPAIVIGAALLTIAVCDDLRHLAVGLVSAAVMLLIARRGVPLLAIAPLAWLGAISYSLYLLHQLIGFALLRHLQAAGIHGVAAFVLTLAAVLLLATCVTRLVEQPALRAIRSRYRHPGRTAREASTQPVPVSE